MAQPYPTIQERVLALYGLPGLESWSKVGKRLRIKKGSAWSLAHGLRKPDPRTTGYLECIEWGLNYREQAAANLAALLNGNAHRTKGEE